MKPLVHLSLDNAEEVTVQQVEYPAFIEEIGRLRYDVWVSLIQPNYTYFVNNKWLDENDPTSYHWVVQSKGELIASARLSIHAHVKELRCFTRIPAEAYPWIDTPVASLNRLVVRQNYRGQKIAPFLDKIRIEFARERGVKSIVGEPILSRIKSLEGLDFKVFEPIYFIPDLPGVPVKFMVFHM